MVTFLSPPLNPLSSSCPSAANDPNSDPIAEGTLSCLSGKLRHVQALTRASVRRDNCPINAWWEHEQRRADTEARRETAQQDTTAGRAISAASRFYCTLLQGQPHSPHRTSALILLRLVTADRYKHWIHFMSKIILKSVYCYCIPISTLNTLPRCVLFSSIQTDSNLSPTILTWVTALAFDLSSMAHSPRRKVTIPSWLLDTLFFIRCTFRQYIC